MSRGKAIELPPLASIETAAHGVRRFLYQCAGCGLGRRMASAQSAGWLAWSHAEDFPCDAVEAALEAAEEEGEPEPVPVRTPCAAVPKLTPGKEPGLFDELS